MVCPCRIRYLALNAHGQKLYLSVKIENFVSYIFLNKINELTVVLCEYYLNCAYAALAACYIKIKVKKKLSDEAETENSK